MKELIIVGAGGLGRELLLWIEIINREHQQWQVKGFIDDNLKVLEGYACDYGVIGRIDNWQPGKNEVFACAVADPKAKEKVVTVLKSKGAFFERIIHPTAFTGKHNKIGEGVVMYPKAQLTVNVTIGDFVTLFSSSLGHDVTIGDYSTISPFCLLNGNVQVGKRVFMGSHVTVVPGRKIGDDAFLAPGSVIVSNIRPNKKVMGNPAKTMRV